MGRISIQNSGEYQSSSGNSYFQLPNDKDSAEVVFLYDDPTGNDIDYFLCHQIEIDGYNRWVNCNAVDEDGNDNPDNCACCRDGFPRMEKLFLQLYNFKEEKKQTWDRGSKFVGTISTFVERYGSLVTQPFEIVRNGRKGDTSTTYALFPTEEDPEATIESYGGRDELLGTLILDLTDDEMYDAMDGNYHMPNNNSRNDNSSNRRRSSNRGNDRQQSQRRERTAPSSRTGRSGSRDVEERPRSERSSVRERGASQRGTAQTRDTERSSSSERGTTRERSGSVRGSSERRSSPSSRRSSPRR